MLGTGCYYYNNNNRGSRKKGQGKLKGRQARDIGSGRAWPTGGFTMEMDEGRGVGQAGATIMPFVGDEESDGLKELSHLSGNLWPSLAGEKLMAGSV